MIIGCLIFYDDGPVLLDSCLESLSKVTDLIIAVDGVFSEFPHEPGQIISPAKDVEIVKKYAKVFISNPPTPNGWANQCDKRNAYLIAAGAVCGPKDHLLILDADEIVTGTKPAFFKKDFYKVPIKTISVNNLGPMFQCRLFRYHPEIRYVGKHTTLKMPGGGLSNITEADDLQLCISY